jgi:cyclic pyranopterin phosphate synthase
LLSLEEIALIAERFIARGVRKIRLTGGEPLVRRDMIDLAHRLGRQVGGALDELTLTTNGTRLAEHAEELFAAGMRRINVSLDSRDPDRFRYITRHGDVAKVLEASPRRRRQACGQDQHGRAEGPQRDEIAPMLAWAGKRRAWT